MAFRASRRHGDASHGHDNARGARPGDGLAKAVDALYGFPSGCASWQGNPPPAALSDEEFRVLDRHLQRIRDIAAGDPQAPATVLADHSTHLALLKLVAAALRLPLVEQCYTGSEHSARHVSLASTAVETVRSLLHDVKPGGRTPAEPLRNFVRSLLRTDALQAASRLLAAAADPLAAAAAAAATSEAAARKPASDVEAATAPREATEAPEHPGSTECGQTSSASAPAVPGLLISLALQLLGFVYRVVLAVGQVMSTLNGGDLDAAVRDELVAALHDSRVLEHAARVTLLLAPVAMEHHGERLSRTLLFSATVHCTLADLLECYEKNYDGDGCFRDRATRAAFLAQLRGALLGPCVRILVLAYGVATLATIDGGHTYGLPPHVLAALPVSLTAQPGRGASCNGWFALNTMMLLPTLSTRTPPLGRRGGMALATRVCRAALRAAAADLDSGGGNTATIIVDGTGSGGDRMRRRPSGDWPSSIRIFLEVDKIPHVALDALSAVRALLPPQPGSPRYPAEAEEYWRLVAEVMGARGPLRFADQFASDFGDLLAFSSDTARVLEAMLKGYYLQLPASPPLEIAAALAGGLLPCLERLLRRAGQAPSGPEARVVRCLLSRDPWVIWCYFAPVLAYGDPAQTASLVATLGKLLRLVDPRTLLSARWQPSEDTQQCVVHAAIAVLAETLLRQQVHVHSSSRTDVQKLARSLSSVACQWLPPLSRLIQQALHLHGDLPPAWKKIAPESLVSTLGMMRALLRWLPVLAARCVAACGGTGTSAVGRACSGAGGAAAQGSASTPEAAMGLAGTAAAHGSDGAGADCCLVVSSESSAAGAGAAGHAAADPAAPAAAGADAGGWLLLLLEEVDAVALLGAALELAPGLAEAGAECASDQVESFLVRLVDGCSAVAAVCVEPGAGVADAAAAGASGASGASPGGPRGGGGGAAAALSCWRPKLLQAVGGRLRELGYDLHGRTAEALAAQVEGNGGTGGGEGTLVRPEFSGLFTEALLPPSEVRLLLRTCANPGCANLAGDSEAGLSLKACSGCGVAGYCGRACQTAHWREGHKEECKRRV